MDMQKQIAWHKIQKAVRQEFRHDTSTTCAERIANVMESLPAILHICGKQSCTQRSVSRIARALACPQPLILAPCCPDYTHRNGVYTFTGIGSRVSLLAEQHIRFLESLTPLIPSTSHILFLLADQEAEDLKIVQRIGVSQEVFKSRIAASLASLQERIASFGWKAEYMTTAVADFRTTSEMYEQRLTTDTQKNQRITSETIQRRPMYHLIDQQMTIEEGRQRTIRTASQYLALGSFAASQHALICNHTTTNLAWYAETGAALLHNPISIY